MDDESCFQVVALGDFRVASPATLEQLTFGQQPWASGIVNGTVNASTTQKRGVRRIDNGVDVELSDIACNDFDLVQYRPASLGST